MFLICPENRKRQKKRLTCLLFVGKVCLVDEYLLNLSTVETTLNSKATSKWSLHRFQNSNFKTPNSNSNSNFKFQISNQFHIFFFRESESGDIFRLVITISHITSGISLSNPSSKASLSEILRCRHDRTVIFHMPAGEKSSTLPTSVTDDVNIDVGKSQEIVIKCDEDKWSWL